MFFATMAGILDEKVHGPGALCTEGILLYPMFLYAAITYIGVSDGWIATFVIACLGTWICDSFALFGGKAFGKHKVAPYVSPHKTVEGCICGALSSPACRRSLLLSSGCFRCEQCAHVAVRDSFSRRLLFWSGG